MTLPDYIKDQFPRELQSPVEQLADWFYEKSPMRQDMRELTNVVKELAESQKELAEAQKELAEAQKRTEKELRGLARQVGGLSENIGGNLESLAVETLPAVLNEEWELKVLQCEQEPLAAGDKELEFDLVARCLTGKGEPLTVLCEVKSNLTEKEVERHLKKASKAAPGIKGEVRVVFFGFRVNLAARELIKKSGAYMIFGNGRFMKVFNAG